MFKSSSTDTSVNLHRIKIRIVLISTTVALFAFVFRGVIFGQRSFSFRDTANFHAPLFRLVHEQWQQGEVPLWNPYAVGGMPLLAIGTSAVLYPPQLIFLLPLEFETKFVWFLLLHFLLAITFQYVLSKRLGCSSLAATVSTLTYVFGGSVLFQYCNVPFLCSVAWMPACLYAAHRAISQRCFMWSSVVGFTLALMVLAGDPQNAYHAVMLASFFALLYGWMGAKNALTGFTSIPCSEIDADGILANPATETSKLDKSLVQRFLRSPLIALQVPVMAAAFWGLALSAAQLIPTQELAKLSTRAEWSVPDNIYRIPAYFLRGGEMEPRPDTGAIPNWYDVIIGNPPPPAKQYLMRYPFSFIPWRLAEVALPNVFGRSVNPGDRWLARNQGEDPNLWLPSVYAGLLPLILAWKASRFGFTSAVSSLWRKNRANRAIAESSPTIEGRSLKSQVSRKEASTKRKSVDSARSTKRHAEVGAADRSSTEDLASVHVIRETDHLDDSVVRCWSTWVCCLGVVFSFGGYGLVWLGRLVLGGDLTHPHETPGGEVGGGYWFLSTFLPAYAGFRYPAKWLTIAAIGFAILAGKGYDMLIKSKKSVAMLGPPMLVMGGLTLSAVIVLALISRRENAVTQSLLHTAAVAMTYWMWCRWVNRLPRLRIDSWQGCVPVVILAVDLAVANHWMVQDEPTSLRAGVPDLATVVHEDWKERSVAAGLLASTPRLYLADGVVGDDFQLIKGFFAANQDIGYFETTTGTMQIARNEFFLDSLPYPTENGVVMLQPRRGLDLWGVDYFVVPKTDVAIETDGRLVGLGRDWLEDKKVNMPSVLPEGPPITPIDVSDKGQLVNIAVLPNRKAMPDAWVVHQAEVMPPLAPSQRSDLLELMLSIVFPFSQHRNLRDKAIVESDDMVESLGAGITSFSPLPIEASVQVLRRSPSEVEIDVDLSAEGLVVLADTYYPGWTAARFTNGKKQPVEVLKTNLAMRGMVLPAGQHHIVMRYSPKSFQVGSGISLVTLLCFVIVVSQRVIVSNMGLHCANAKTI